MCHRVSGFVKVSQKCHRVHVSGCVKVKHEPGLEPRPLRYRASDLPTELLRTDILTEIHTPDTL